MLIGNTQSFLRKEPLYKHGGNTKIVGIAAYSSEPPSHIAKGVEDFVDELGKVCGDGIVIVVGGYWGTMKIVVDEALKRGITTIVLPPVEREHTDFPERAIVLRLGVSYRVRSAFLARACDVLVALGGCSGTMQEIVSAYCEAKPILVLRTGLDSDKLETLGPYLDSRALTRVEFFDDPRRLAKRVAELLNCRHP